jgi:methylase of polypeptide subunit release factors
MDSKTSAANASIDDVARRLIGMHTSLEYVTDVFDEVGIPSLYVLPSVFRPEVSFSGAFLARSLPALASRYTGKSVLDMGCGSGILGLVCSKHGASSVTFTDVSPAATQNATKNAKKLGIHNWTAATGSLFDPVDGRSFDVVVFNPPGISGSPKDLVEATVMSEDRLIDAFFDQLPTYLNHGGIAIMPTSTKHATERSPQTHAESRGYGVEMLAEHVRDDGSTQYAIAIHT